MKAERFWEERSQDAVLMWGCLTLSHLATGHPSSPLMRKTKERNAEHMRSMSYRSNMDLHLTCLLSLWWHGTSSTGCLQPHCSQTSWEETSPLSENSVMDQMHAQISDIKCIRGSQSTYKKPRIDMTSIDLLVWLTWMHGFASNIISYVANGQCACVPIV